MRRFDGAQHICTPAFFDGSSDPTRQLLRRLHGKTLCAFHGQFAQDSIDHPGAAGSGLVAFGDGDGAVDHAMGILARDQQFARRKPQNGQCRRLWLAVEIGGKTGIERLKMAQCQRDKATGPRLICR